MGSSIAEGDPQAADARYKADASLRPGCTKKFVVAPAKHLDSSGRDLGHFDFRNSTMVPAPISDRTTPEAGPSDLKGKSKALRDTFSTLKRERTFRDPSDQKPDYPALHELVAPHIESFNALFEGGTNSKGQAEKGLLELGIQDIKPRVIFDGRGRQGERGNRLESG